MQEEDYVMRVIHEMVATLLKLVFHIDLGKNEVSNFKDDVTAAFYEKLLDLMEAGKINEAENIILDELDSGNIEHYKMALMFYEYLNQKNTKYLEEHGFSKYEIIDGLKYVSAIYGYESMSEVLLGRGSE